MTLSELLIAGVITSSSCCASLQVWGQACHIARSARDVTEASALLERHWLASYRWLSAAPAVCSLEAAGLEEALEQALPLALELSRSIDSNNASLGWWLELQHPASGLERRQLLTSAGLGVCPDITELPSAFAVELPS
jgi:hypothetical protein